MRLALALALALVPVASARALEPRAHPDQMARTSWPSVAHTSAVRALLFRPEGVLWIGTAEGLVRFDGRGMVPFDRQRLPGIVDGNIERLFAASDGSLWIASRGSGLSRLDGAGVATLDEARGLPSNLVRAFAETGDGAIWVGTFGGVARLARGSRRPERLSEGLPDPRVDALAVDGTGGLWAGTRGGLARWDPAARRWRLQLGPLDSPVRVHALLAAPDGRLWVGTVGAGLLELDSGQWRRHGLDEGLASLTVSALLADRGGRLWVATRGGGLGWRDPGETRFRSFAQPLGRCDGAIDDLAEDAEGSLWIGTDSCGLQRVGDRPIQIITEREGLASDLVLGVAGQGDSLWVGTRGFGTARVRIGGPGALAVEPLACRAGIPCGGCWDIAPAGAGFWAVCGNNDLLHWNGTDMTRGALPPGLAAASMVARARDGALWLALEQRVVRWHQGVADRLRDQEGLSGKRLLHEGRDGTMWIPANDGVAAWRRGALTITRFPAREAEAEVANVDEDAEGRLWLATKGGGLWLLRRGRLSPVGVAQGLPTSWIVQVLADDRGRLWMSTSKGILWVARQELEDVAEGRRPRIYPSVYDGGDGVLMDRDPYGHPAGWKSADGRLWFATRGGVAVIDPARLKPVPPRVVIDELRIADRPVGPTAARAPLAARGPGDLAVRFSAASFAAPELISFRYRLEGKEGDWIDLGAGRSLLQPQLAPGRYRLVIQARHRDGDWTGPGVAMPFELRPAFYRSGWFGLAMALALAGALLGAHRLRLTRARADLHAVMLERSRIARDIHDTLAQAFVATSVQLECLDKAVESNDRATVRHHLEAARRMVKESLEEARRSVWVLRPRSLEHGLPAALQSLAGGASGETLVELEIEGAPRPLAPAVEANLLRIAQEAVANAYRHARARRIVLRLAYRKGRSVSLAILDDGTGLPGAATAPERGLAGMKERAADIGAGLTIESRDGGGTAVRVELSA